MMRGPKDNFVHAILTGKKEDQKTDIQEGYLSACISHMGNISYQIAPK